MKTILAIFLIIIIIGGLGYIGYSYFFMGSMNHDNMNMTPQESAQPTQTNQNNKVPNTIAVQNQDRLNQAVSLLNQAMEQITLDPYSNITLPTPTGIPGQMPSGNSDTVNIYPGGNSTVIVPDQNTSSTAPPAITAQPNVMQGNTASNNYVYNQGLLTQLHSSIYSVSQGIMMLNQLNADLTLQSAQAESYPADYTTYVNRYSSAYQNKIKLNNAIAKFSSVSNLINSNPYAQNGYAFNSTYMDQLHKGISMLGQATVILNQLDADFTSQMQAASIGAGNAAAQPNYYPMIHGGSTSNTVNLPLIINIILIIFVLGLIIGIIGAIVRLVRRGNGPKNDNPI